MRQYACNCCKQQVVARRVALPTSMGGVVAASFCGFCHCLTPHFPDRNSQETSRQAEYHFNYWKSDGPDVLEDVVQALKDMVDFYRPSLKAPEEQRKIIEIGAGRGCLIEALRRRGYAGVTGCEPSHGLVSMARVNFGLSEAELQCKSAMEFLESYRDGAKIDIAFMWHVLEHLDDPLTILTAIRDLLSIDGLILLQTPMTGKSNIFPEHLFLTTRSSIFHIARIVGMKVTFYAVDHKSQFLSFTLARQECSLPAVPEPTEDGFDLWIHDLHDSLDRLKI